MTDKQRADHVQAKYWNGFITRTEAQKVYDEQQQVITAQAAAIQKIDAVISCIAEKVGVTPADVNEWLKSQAEKIRAANEAQAKAQEAHNAAQKANGAAPEQANNAPAEPSRIKLTDMD